MIKKRLICLNMAIVMAISLLSGCGEEKKDSTEIELVDPVGVTANYAYAERHDLVSYNVYNGVTVPTVSEVAFTTAQNFKSYGSLPGSEVKRGDAVINASTDSIDERIKLLKESMSADLESHNEYIDEIREELAKEKNDNENYKQVLDRLSKLTDAQKKAEQAQIDRFNALMTASNAYILRYEEQIKESTELYELDSAYNQKKLNRLYKERANVLATSKIDGTVVAVNYFDINEWINKDRSVAAVGDFSNLILRTEYVYSNDIKKAKDYYAFINGKRYEIEYIAPDASEVGGFTTVTDAKSSFRVSDPNHEIKAGDYAVIVVVNAVSEDALCVPVEAVNKDDDGYYVYLFDGENTVNTSVRTGIRSGLYVEILSGLKDGDRVVSNFKVDNKTKTQELSRGSVSTEFSKNGFLFYSNQQNIKNPVEYGTVYIQEMLVSQYQRVAKGEAVAKISVIKDDINIRRKERQILRENEDLKELNEDPERNKKLIKMKKEYIADLQEQVDKMKADGAKTEIIAPFDGIITSVGRFTEGDMLRPDESVVVISEEKDCFVIVEDEAGQLSYGAEAEIAYEDADGNKRVAHGETVTVTPWALSEDLHTGYSLIRVSSEDLALMAGSNRGMDGWWMRSHFSVTAKTRHMQEVVLVPKRSVRTEGGITYVTVLNENNKPVLKSFIAGGSDSTYYWVIDGLSEGTKICLE